MICGFQIVFCGALLFCNRSSEVLPSGGMVSEVVNQHCQARLPSLVSVFRIEVGDPWQTKCYGRVP